MLIFEFVHDAGMNNAYLKDEHETFENEMCDCYFFSSCMNIEKLIISDS